LLLRPAFLATAIAIVTLGYVVASAAIRPAMYSDSAWGFVGWDTRSRTPAFNHAAGLDPSDISREAEGFVTMWSPGQHVLPGLLEEAGISLGAALVAVSAIFSVLGLAGWFALYRSLGFPLRTAMVALAIVACSRFFNLPFSTYNGGEVLQFGVAPWFLLLVWVLRDLRWFAMLPLIAGAAVLVFMKLSGIIVAGAAIGAAMVSHDHPLGQWRNTVRKLLVGGATLGVMGAIFYIAWYSRGATAASIVGVPHPHGLLFYTALTVSSIGSAALSIGDLASYVFLNPSRPVLQSIDPIVYVLLPLSLATFGFIYFSLRSEHGEYVRFAFLFAAAMAAFLTANLLMGMSITFDERHLRIPSLLLLVGGVHAVLQSQSRIVQAVFATVAALSMIYGVSSFVQRMDYNLHEPLGARGVRVRIATQQLLDFVHKTDVSGRDAGQTLIFMPSPDLALEVRNARSWSNHADFQSIAELRNQIWRGRVERLYVIVQQKLVDNGKADAILRSFVDYPLEGWVKVPLGDFVCFYQVSS
jgi:hypothetical protein